MGQKDSGNSLTPYIKSLLVGKLCLGHSIHLLYLCAQREGKNSLFQGRVTQAILNCQETLFFTFVVYTKKSGYFTVSVLQIFFGVLLTLYYDYRCSEMDFTPEMSAFFLIPHTQ